MLDDICVVIHTILHTGESETRRGQCKLLLPAYVATYDALDEAEHYYRYAARAVAYIFA